MICLGNTSKIITSNFSTHDPINVELQNIKNLFGGLIKKNVRLCVNVGMQQERGYFHNTFSTVVN